MTVTQLQLRRGTAAQVAAFTGAQGEAVVDTDNNRVVVNDGTTAGGFSAAKVLDIFRQRCVQSSGDLPIASSDRIVNCKISSPLAVTVPLATGRAGFPLRFKNVSTSTAIATFNATSPDTFDGLTSITLVPGGGFELIPFNDGVNAGYEMEAPAVQLGVWTPAIAAGTPGNLAVSYSTQNGEWLRFGSWVLASCDIVTSAFTHTTSSGQMFVSGLPFNANDDYAAGLDFSGLNKSGGYTNIVAVTAASSKSVFFELAAQGVSIASLQITDAPTAGAIDLRFSLLYQTVDA